MQKAYPLFLEDRAAFEGEIGGAEMDFYVIATELAKNQDFSITFYTGDYGQDDAVPIAGNLTLRKFPYWNEKKYPGFHHKLLKRILCIWTLFRDRSDVFFSESHNELWGYVVLVRKLLMRKPTIYRIASDLDLVSPDRKKLDIHDRVFLFGFRRTDFFIAQNPTQQRLLESGWGRKSTVIRNALRDEALAPDIVHGKDTLLWVGRGIPLKQPMKFVELAKSLPEERFVMVFPGRGELKDETIRHSGDLDNLEVIDFVDPKKIQDTYSRAKCLVNTSTHEGFPNSFVQAFMGGTPVVALNVDPDGILSRFDIGHWCHGDLSEAREYIEGLSPERTEELFKNCRTYFSENHDIATVIKQYETLFADILG